jgi:hypothetical protein
MPVGRSEINQSSFGVSSLMHVFIVILGLSIRPHAVFAGVCSLLFRWGLCSPQSVPRLLFHTFQTPSRLKRSQSAEHIYAYSSHSFVVASRA